MIKYYLVKNLLSKDKINYIAKAVENRRYDMDDLVNEIIEMGSSLEESDIRGVILNLHKVVTRVTEQGGSIQTELFSTKPSITGTFEDTKEVFNEEKHKLHINLKGGKLFQDAIKNIHLEKVESPIGTRQIVEIIDLDTDSVNSRLTTNGVVEIHGSKIKLVGDDILDRLILINSSGSGYQFKKIISNEPKKIVAQMPSHLDPGDYELQIRTRYTSGGTMLKKDVYIVFPKKLIVRNSTTDKKDKPKKDNKDSN